MLDYLTLGKLPPELNLLKHDTYPPNSISIKVSGLNLHDLPFSDTEPRLT